MLTRWSAVLAEVVLATLLAVGCFSAGLFFPFLGAMVTLLSPLPLVVLAMRRGRAALLAGVVLAPLLLGVLGSRFQAAAFALEFVGPALILAEGLRRGRRPEGLTLGIALWLSVGGLAVLLLGARQWSQPHLVVRQHLDALLRDVEGMTARLGLADGPEAAAASAAQLRGFLLTAFPGLFFAGNLLAAAGYDAALRWLVRRHPAVYGGRVPEPWRFQLPEHLVWTFIGSGALYLSGLSRLTETGLNGLIALVGLYFLQGVSILLFWIQRFQLPRFLVVMSVVVLMVQPLAMLLIAGVGLFDVWCAFRRPTLPNSPGVS
ncbi:MAG: DUF2232 domain-containing protein [candidate division NC10 bacterium]|nr:DUF2232 domain-containing protein [candidate division NC10 bacterium]